MNKIVTVVAAGAALGLNALADAAKLPLRMEETLVEFRPDLRTESAGWSHIWEKPVSCGFTFTIAK